MDRGYRSADLFNKIIQAGHDFIFRLTAGVEIQLYRAIIAGLLFAR